MRRILIPLAALLALLLPASLPAAKQDKHPEPERPADTGFLNRKVTLHGATYRYMVYLPEDYDPHRKWPVILFLHGMGERGSDGESETNIGLPAALRNHPERWPFVVVMPQVPYSHHYWPDPDMMAMAMAELDASSREFHGDPDRTCLAGISLGGFGAWELAKTYPARWAAIVTVAGGIRWDWVPNGRMGDPHLADGYVTAVGKTPVWIFHGADDHTVSPSQSEEMYDALKAGGGHVRFWEYERVGHASWDRAFAEPELPRWLLAHALHEVATSSPYAEKRLVPIHPVPARVDPNLYEQYAGEYSAYGSVRFWVTHDGDRLELHQKSSLNVLLPESASTYFFESGGPTRFVFNRDSSGRVVSLTYRDDRHEEVFEKTR
jgi:acetyl esterase/lipase